MKSFTVASFVAATIASVSAHYTFPYINGQAAWQSTRQTNNYNSQAPVTDVTSDDIRCYNTATKSTATTLAVAAGSVVTLTADGTVYHPGPNSVYMAKAPTTAAGWDPTGAVWFKVYENAGSAGASGWNWPSESLTSISFTLPSALPAGEYLVRVEQIGLHVAQSYGGAQFYLACSQISVSSGGSGTPGPLVAFPGAYTGYESGILININYPPVMSYTPPGPAVWTGGNSGSAPPTSSSSVKPTTTTTTSSVKSTTTTKSTTSVAPPKSTTTTASASGATQTAYGQCGGTGWTGPTVCASGTTCKAVSPPYYSQCS